MSCEILTVSLSVMYELWNINSKPEPDVMNCEIQTASLSVMYELWNINSKPERDVWVVKYNL